VLENLYKYLNSAIELGGQFHGSATLTLGKQSMVTITLRGWECPKVAREYFIPLPGIEDQSSSL
jgi:hypothetical protein